MSSRQHARQVYQRPPAGQARARRRWGFSGKMEVDDILMHSW
ncbi:MAG: hypothetical protein R3C62_12380 [Chloroflexota bacterium]